MSHHSKMEIVQLLISQKEINLGLQNSLKKTCYEAYSDAYASDEAANKVEEAHHGRKDLNKNESNFMLRPAKSESEIYL